MEICSKCAIIKLSDANIVLLIANIFYFFIIVAIGMMLSPIFFKPQNHSFALSFLTGSIIIGLYIFFICLFNLLNMTTVSIILLSGILCLSLQCKNIVIISRDNLIFLKQELFKHDRWSHLFMIVFFLFIIWLILLAYTPPRAADAMRYHLSQVKDIAMYHGFIFRPYVHYNFPIYFSLLFLPLFYLFGGISIKLATSTYFLLSILLLVHLAKTLAITHTRLLFFLIFLIPIAYDNAHSALNDWPLIFYILLGSLFLLKIDKHPYHTLLAFASLGFSIGIKYQAAIFIPWFLFVAFRSLTGKKILLLLASLSLCLLIPAIFFIRNWINLHNPIWPLGLHFFSNKDPYLQQVAISAFSPITGGKHTFNALINSFINLSVSPLIPAVIWLLILPSLVWSTPTKLHLQVCLVLYFLLFWIMQPGLNAHYTIYLLPLGILSGVNFYEYLFKKKLMPVVNFYQILITFIVVSHFIFAGYYSIFYLRYYLYRNLDEYHQYTWFYQDYQWINRYTPQHARILVLIASGQTYYLNRDYLRAAPDLSATINWCKVASADALINQLQKNHIQYILYQNMDWSSNVCGKQMMQIVTKLINSNKTRLLYRKKEKLYVSRIKKQYETTEMLFIQLTA